MWNWKLHYWRMSDAKRRNSADPSAELDVKKRRRINNDGSSSSSNNNVDILPPMRLSENIWVAAIVGKDTSIVATERDKRFAEGKKNCVCQRVGGCGVRRGWVRLGLKRGQIVGIVLGGGWNWFRSQSSSFGVLFSTGLWLNWLWLCWQSVAIPFNFS